MNRIAEKFEHGNTGVINESDFDNVFKDGLAVYKNVLYSKDLGDTLIQKILKLRKKGG